MHYVTSRNIDRYSSRIYCLMRSFDAKYSLPNVRFRIFDAEMKLGQSYLTLNAQ